MRHIYKERLREIYHKPRFHSIMKDIKVNRQARKERPLAAQIWFWIKGSPQMTHKNETMNVDQH